MTDVFLILFLEILRKQKQNKQIIDCNIPANWFLVSRRRFSAERGL